MKKIGIREFQQNIYKHLEELPVVITKHNQPFAIVEKYQSEHVTENKNDEEVSKELSDFKMPDTWTDKFGKKSAD